MDLINVSDVVSSFNQQILYVQSFGVGTRVNGRYQPNPNDLEEFQGQVQHANASSLVGLSEGLKTSRFISVFTTYELRGVKEVGEAIADIIIWQGQKYRVFQVSPWNENGYNEAVAVEIKE